MIKILFICHGRSCGRIVGTLGLLGIWESQEKEIVIK